MKIKEICEMLNVTRQGVEMLKEIRKQSKQVLVVTEPTDPHSAETISGMQSEINRLRAELEIMWIKHLQGVYLRNSIEDLVKDSKGLDIYAKRELNRLTKAFDDNIKDKAVKKQIKENKKANEPLLESLGQTKLF